MPLANLDIVAIVKKVNVDLGTGFLQANLANLQALHVMHEYFQKTVLVMLDTFLI